METLEHAPCSIQSLPGIVIFSHSMQVRWANQRARDLIAQAGGPNCNHEWLAAENLPLEVVDLAAKMLEELESQVPSQGWRYVEAHRMVRTKGGRFALRGFAFPGLEEFTNFHLVILITEPESSDIHPIEVSGFVAHATEP